MEQDVLQDYLNMQGYSTKTKVVITSAIRQERSIRDLERTVRKIAEAYDRDHQEKAKVAGAAKRAVKQFLKGIGWLD